MSTEPTHGDSMNPSQTSEKSLLRRRIGRASNRFRQSKLAVVGFVVFCVFALVALFAPILAPSDPSAHSQALLQSPSLEHPFGTDRYGRDLFSRVLMGARTAMIVSILVPLVATVFGVPIGLLAAYFGGWIDEALMRFMDSLFAFPAILLALTIISVFGQGLFTVVTALATVFVPRFARITRGSALSAVNQDHTKAAKSLGASHHRIIALHVFPFCVSAILVQFSIAAGYAIIMEASLSFLGLGVGDMISWGVILREGKSFLSVAWWYSVFPGVAIALCVLGFNLLGDGLRDVADPRTEFEQ